MVVNVIPAVKLPRSVKSVYSYKVPSDLEAKILVGQIVEVDFRGRKIQAVITEIQKARKHENTEGKKILKHENIKTEFVEMRPASPYTSQGGRWENSEQTKQEEKKEIVHGKFEENSMSLLKEVQKIAIDMPLVTGEQIELVKWMSEYYFVSPALLMKSLVPKIPKKIKISALLADRQEYKNKKINKKLKIKNKKQFWYHGSEKDKIKLYKKEISKNLKAGPSSSRNGGTTTRRVKQTVVFTPTISEAEKLAVELGGVMIKSNMGTKEELEKWVNILSGKEKVIITTKIGVFWPFNNLGSIIIDRAESWDHKQSEINPRFDVRKCVEMMAELSGSRVYVASGAYGVEEFKDLPCELGSAKAEISQSKELRIKGNVGIKIVDLANEYKIGQAGLIGNELESAIRETLSQDKKVFLFLNRKGEGTTTVCQDCGLSFECKDCKIPLTMHDKGYMRCHFCGTVEELPPFCPRCQGPNIKSFGLGTGKVVKYLKNKFVGIDIVEIYKTQITISKKITNSKFQIAVGTEFALDKIGWDEIGLVGVLNADVGLMIPDFRASERVYQLLNRVIGLTKKETKVIIQTYRPDNHVMRAIGSGKPEIFYNEELKSRQELSYPPFVRLIKLIYQDVSKQKAGYMADVLYRDLKKLIKKEKMDGVEVLEPVKAYHEKVRGRFRYYVIIKISREGNIKTILSLVPNDWMIDVEPESLL